MNFSLNELAKFLLEFTNESSIMHSLINEKTREIAIIKAESGDLNCYEMSRAKAKVRINFLFFNFCGKKEPQNYYFENYGNFSIRFF